MDCGEGVINETIGLYQVSDTIFAAHLHNNGTIWLILILLTQIFVPSLWYDKYWIIKNMPSDMQSFVSG